MVNIGNDTHGLVVCGGSLAYNATPTSAFRAYGISGVAVAQFSAYSSGSANTIEILNNAGSALSVISLGGNFGIRQTSPTAFCHLGAGTTSANTAPLKFTSGSFMTTPETGAVEWDGDKFAVTGATAIRQTLVGCIFTKTSTTTVGNTTTETSVVGSGVGTVTLPANFLKVGKTLRFTAWGYITADGLANLTPKIKLGSTVIDTGSAAPTMPAIATAIVWKFEALCTCYTTGASGTLWTQGQFTFYLNAGTVVQGFSRENLSTVTLDTTAQQVADMTMQWGGSASATNTLTCTNLTVEVLN